ncbi:hypothetical protein SAJA_02900 [Salinisphaera japonica YTM-1]|uniref:Uncharacterized protein n=1 Tax=Salinisphaera japonica YTM-1 TaxID=1209778 RepID=A0A423Q0E2_9GAMM|nr:hypothetical protein SAJA_02900 [Salinisphaera japonica YTM-1]
MKARSAEPFYCPVIPALGMSARHWPARRGRAPRPATMSVQTILDQPADDDPPAWTE